MPSVVIDNARSGGMPLLSGNYYSGQGPRPRSVLVLKASRNNSGCLYIGLSGNVTVLSGSYPLSGGGGQNDGMEIGPGGSYEVPLMGMNSGGAGVYLSCDPAASGGFARVFWEAY